MASRARSPELEEARRSVRSLARKDEELQKSGGKLDKNGEPELTAENRSAPSNNRDSGSSARTSLQGGPQINGTVNTSLPGDDSEITGRVGGNAKGRFKELRDEPQQQPKKQEAILRPTKLHLPVVRSKRPANADGATSFHFAHEAISKTPIERTSERGTKTRKGSARDHARYIERDEAIAKMDTSELNKIEGDLKELAKNDPELAERLGLDTEALKDDDKEIPEQDVAKALSVGQIASVYIEREEALAHNDNGIALLFTNISDDAKERREFWKLVEDHESDPSADVMKLTIGHHKTFWKKVEEDEDCPVILKRALQAGKSDEEIKIRTGDNQAVRKLMKKHGWRPPEKRPEGETDQQRDEREEREAMTARGAKFEDGRGGRVQFRIVGELPYDVPHDARIRILKKFSDEFEKRNLPFIAVMHAPDHTNDDRNWHFHLVYHDRPARKFTGDPKDHMWDLPDQAGVQLQRQHELLKKTLEDESLKQHAGKWDFTVPWQYKKNVSRNIVTTHPFAQNKNREANNRKFIPGLRRILADLTNEELEKADKERRLDPRRYSDMGIHKATEKHLGTTNARLENMGIQTPVGKENEEKQWDFVKSKIEDERRRAEQHVDNQIKKWNSSLNASELNDRDRERAEKAMVRWEQAKREFNEHHALALALEEHLARMASRAEKVRKVAKKHVDAINDNLATRRQAKSLEKYQDKLDEAEQHLARLELYTTEEFNQIATSRGHRDEKGKEAEHYQKLIDSIIGDGQARRRESENASAPVSRETKAGQGSQRRSSGPPSGSAMGNSTLDRFIEKIVKTGRRLVRDEGWIIPKNPNEEERKVIGAANYSSTQTRLKKVKSNQDGMIADLVAGLASNPGMLKTKKMTAGKKDDASIADRYRLATKDKRLQAAFRMFHDDPKVMDAIANLEGKKSSDPKRDPEAKEAPGPGAADRDASRNETVREESGEKTSKKKAFATIMTIMADKKLRPAITKDGGDAIIAFRKQEAILYDLPEEIRVTNTPQIKRVTGLLAKHDRAVKRLTAYVDKNPSKVIAGKAGEIARLVEGAPKELKKIAEQYARDPQVKRLMEDALIKARLEKLKPKRAEAVDNDSSQKREAGDLFSNSETRAESKSDKKDATEKTAPSVPEGYRINAKGKLVIDTRGPGVEVGGARSVSEDAETEEASRRIARKKHQDDGKTDKTILNEEAIAIAKDKSSGKTIPLTKGIDPKIDRWIDADDANDREARRKAAMAIKSDRALLGRIRDLEPKARARFQRDWDGMDADRKKDGQTNERERRPE